MKIAAITDDGQTISQHFGRASHYLVCTIDNDVITDRELRGKLGHADFKGEAHHHEAGEHGERHGFGPEAHDRHSRMAAAIADCQVLLCRGMGAGAYQSMQDLGIRPLVTDIESIEEAVSAYIAGRIVDRVDRLH